MQKRWNALSLLAAAGLLASMGTADASRSRSRMSGSPDRLFMVQTAYINIGEVKAGQLAQTRAVNANVRDYSQHMIASHSRANMALKRLAARKGVRLPADTDLKHRAMGNRLAKLSGAPFDRSYMNAMVMGHQKAIALFQNEANGGRDPQVRAWAGKMLPTLHQHLRMAQQLAGSRAVKTGAKMSPSESSRMMNPGDTHDATNGGNDQSDANGQTDQDSANGGSEKGRPDDTTPQDEPKNPSGRTDQDEAGGTGSSSDKDNSNVQNDAGNGQSDQ